jgi:hypothetical protein
MEKKDFKTFPSIRKELAKVMLLSLFCAFGSSDSKDEASAPFAGYIVAMCLIVSAGAVVIVRIGVLLCRRSEGAEIEDETGLTTSTPTAESKDSSLPSDMSDLMAEIPVEPKCREEAMASATGTSSIKPVVSWNERDAITSERSETENVNEFLVQNPDNFLISDASEDR